MSDPSIHTIDLRSDTVTQPTPAMREAMYNAEVGDDVYGEDPTVKQLETLAASTMNKEAGLLVSSGTMGNLIAVLAHCGRGDEVIMGHLGHTFLYEAGGISALGGVHPHTIPNHVDGTLNLEDIQAAVRPSDIHFPVSRLLILENTHNRCGGVPISAEYIQQAANLTHQYGLFLHIDGARIFNASVALNTKVDSLVQPADSITFCLSKGLCAPVGSVLCGSTEFIHRARRIRKQIGGGMRQAGILAAAGIVAIEQMATHLADDHRRAKILAKGLTQFAGIEVNPSIPPTNLVFARLTENCPFNEKQILQFLSKHNIKVGISAPLCLRMVTHYGISDDDIQETLEVLLHLFGKNRR